MERKIRQGAEALSANARLKPGIGSHWHKLYRDLYEKGSLGDFYDTCAPMAAQIDAGLANGTLALDTRIQDALHRIDPRVASPY